MTLREALQASITMSIQETHDDVMLTLVQRWRRESREKYDVLLWTVGLVESSPEVKPVDGSPYKQHFNRGSTSDMLYQILCDGESHTVPDLSTRINRSINTVQTAICRMRQKGYRVLTERRPQLPDTVRLEAR